MTTTPQALFAALSSINGDYDKMDRYRDFRAVFSTPQGHRVLNEILSQAGVNASTVERRPGPIDPLDVMAREGKRQLALTIIGITFAEPPEKPPVKTISKEAD